MTLLIDVRTQEEFEEAHAENAMHLSIEKIARGEIDLLKNVSKDSPLELYCKSGSRSEMAKDLLLIMGFKNVKNRGGLDKVSLK